MKPSDRSAVEESPLVAPTSGASLKKYLLFLVLAVSLFLNGMAVVRYDIVQKLRNRIQNWRNPIPTLELDIKPLSAQSTQVLALPQGELSIAEVKQWQVEARAKLTELLGVRLPSSMPEVHENPSVDVNGIKRELCTISQLDGMQTPAFVFRPTGSPPFPAIVLIPGHSQGIVATGGIVDDYQHANALALAQAGYMVLTFEVRGLGYLQFMPTDEGVMDLNSHVAARLIEGRTAIGVTVSDAASALEFLAHHPDVDADRLGLVGFSSGGTAAIFLAALDERVKALVASGCVGSFAARYHFSRHDSYEAVPGITRFLEMSDCLAMIAPRAVLSHWGELDNKPQERTAAFNLSSLSTWEAARKAYDAFDASERFRKHISKQMSHEFDNAAAIEFLHRHLPVKR